MRPQHKTAKRRRIELDTPLMPVIIADGVVQAARVTLQADLPESLSDALASRAQVHYIRDDGFAAILRAPGEAGRDELRRCMVGWLVERIKDRHPQAATLLA